MRIQPSRPFNEFVVIDTETTGLHAESRVIEIAMVVVDIKGKSNKKNTKLNRLKQIPKRQHKKKFGQQHNNKFEQQRIEKEKEIEQEQEIEQENSGNKCNCVTGEMKCNGSGFDTCVNNSWIYRSCASGTSCKTSGESIVCDFT